MKSGGLSLVEDGKIELNDLRDVSYRIPGEVSEF